MTDFDVAALRREFPALNLEHGGRALAYFDGPGGTQVPQRVIDAVVGYYRTSNANDGGAFLTSQRSDAIVTEAHAALADLLNATSPEEIKFGYNMTTLTFHLSRSIGATLKPGDEVIVTTLDHEANVSPWRAMAADRGLAVRTVDIRPEDGTLDLDDFQRKLSSRTKLVAFGYASNAIGTINPVAELVRLAHEAGALTYVDAVHYAPHGPIDVQALGTDFLACSTYKFFGPHLGVAYGRADVLDRLPAYKVRPAHDRIETGTQNFEGIAGALAAVEYIASVGVRFGDGFAREFSGWTGRRLNTHTGMRAIRTYELGLFERLLSGLARIDGIRVWGIADLARLGERTPTAALTLDACSPRQAAEVLGGQGITAWDGDFYAQALIERFGLFASGGVLRVGLTHYNTVEEVDRLLVSLSAVAAGSPAAARR
ncbi:MAG: cysteine desulfurase-like protein [Chloroflexi bacterium]|nr:cysteine desulfurase-like protein [Chloroflexota bacterium]